MAGHSKFKNIMHRKGRQDAAKAKIFTKIEREITTAAKHGSPDPAMNPRLRLAVQNARSQSMPKDRIERAIQQAQAAGGDDFKAVRYEGFGPGGIGIALLELDLVTELPGRLEASRVAQVRARATGIVQQRLFTEGSAVKVGQPLFRIDAAPYEAVLASARAQEAKAEVQVAQTQAQWARLRPLVADKAVSEQEATNADGRQAGRGRPGPGQGGRADRQHQPGLRRRRAAAPC